jgi:1,2-phenylacetyl-CoA epoxidase catalytic subunit
MLMEERYHFLHGRSWLRSGIDPEPLLRAWQEALEFFGPPDSGPEGLSMGPEQMRGRLEEQLEMRAPDVAIHWEVWDPLRRRTAPGAVDEHTFAMLRGLEEKKYAPATASKSS